MTYASNNIFVALWVYVDNAPFQVGSEVGISSEVDLLPSLLASSYPIFTVAVKPSVKGNS